MHGATICEHRYCQSTLLVDTCIADIELCPYQLKERCIRRMRRLTMVHSPGMNWLIGAALVIIIGYLLEREIYFYEEVRLVSRLQGRLDD
jgi:hypothetical protein